MKFRAITIVILFFVLVCTSHAQRKSPTRFPVFVYGTWRIHRLKEVGGHAGEKPDLAQKEIDRKISFDRKAISYDRGFLFFDPPCRRVSYTFEVHKIGKHDVGEKGTLDFNNLDPAKHGQVQNIVVRCNGRPKYYFELAKGNQLAIYYDGWFFFLEKRGV